MRWLLAPFSMFELMVIITISKTMVAFSDGFVAGGPVDISRGKCRQLFSFYIGYLLLEYTVM